MSNAKIVVAIVGPTAVGKTNLVFSLAKNWAIEVVSVDSAQVYRNMDIGTAKPTREEQAYLTHHLIDIISPTESFSVGEFVSISKKLISDIWSRNKMPVLVGGTFMYLHGLHYGINSLPNSHPSIRKKIEKEAQEIGWIALHEKLTAIDPTRAMQINKNDRQRIQRALEIYYITGKAMSEHFEKQREKPLKDTPFLICGLSARDKNIVHDMAEKRFKNMIKMGLVDEVISLCKQYGVHEGTPSMRCVGYRQAMKYLNEKQSTEKLIDSGVTATKNLIKRQLTWLNKTPCDILLYPHEDKQAEEKIEQELYKMILNAKQ